MTQWKSEIPHLSPPGSHMGYPGMGREEEVTRQDGARMEP